MSVGIAEIDQQHQEIIERARKFLQSLSNRSRQDTGLLLSYLRTYCVVHFGAEEEWMRVSKYPGRRAHQKEHDGFARKLLALSAEHEKRRGAGLKAAEVSEWLDTWLTTHVASADIAMASHLKAHGLPAPGEPAAP
jgi:hemerythrin